MVGASGSYPFQRQSPWELFASGTCMIAPVEHRQHEFLPASRNQFRASTTNLGFNRFGFSTLPGRDHMHEANGSTRKPAYHCQGEEHTLVSSQVDAQTSTCEAHSPQQKKFVIFDQCGNDTRLILSPLCARVHNKQNVPVSSFGAQEFQQPNKLEQTEVCIKTPVTSEESDENKTVYEGSEMHEDTDEINALLYTDDDDNDNDDDDGEDDEVSTGHSPFVMCEKQDFDEVTDIDISSKRQKVLDGGSDKVPLLCITSNGNQMDQLCENLIGEDSFCSYDEAFSSTIGNKRPRKYKIRDTLRALKSIMPDVKSKDPLAILEEAITYLQTLKSHAETMSMEEEDPDSCTCYGPSI